MAGCAGFVVGAEAYAAAAPHVGGKGEGLEVGSCAVYLNGVIAELVVFADQIAIFPFAAAVDDFSIGTAIGDEGLLGCLSVYIQLGAYADLHGLVQGDVGRVDVPDFGVIFCRFIIRFGQSEVEVFVQAVFGKVQLDVVLLNEVGLLPGQDVVERCVVLDHFALFAQHFKAEDGGLPVEIEGFYADALFLIFAEGEVAIGGAFAGVGHEVARQAVAAVEAFAMVLPFGKILAGIDIPGVVEGEALYMPAPQQLATAEQMQFGDAVAGAGRLSVGNFHGEGYSGAVYFNGFFGGVVVSVASVEFVDLGVKEATIGVEFIDLELIHLWRLSVVPL